MRSSIPSNSISAESTVEPVRQPLTTTNSNPTTTSSPISTTTTTTLHIATKRNRHSATSSIPLSNSRSSNINSDLCARDPPVMAIGGPTEQRSAVPNGASNSNNTVDLRDSASPTRASDDKKQQISVNSLKENGALHNHNVAVHSRVVGVHRFNNPDMSDASEAGPAANDRTADAAPVDANGHSIPAHHLRNSQHQLMHQHHLQQHAGVMGLANAFEGLSVAPPPGAHPHILHHPHHQPPPHHPLAHHPHAHPPGLGPGPPPGMQPHPHAHPHMLSGPPGSQQLPPPHHLSQSPAPHLIQQHAQPTTMQMWVPQDRVGAVIGSQGAVIKALQDRSRATIQVHNDTIRGERKLFTIVGGPAECQIARQLVTEIIERPRTGHGHSGSAAGSASGGPHSPGAPRGDRNSFHPQDGADRSGTISKTVYVPTTCVGLVIGRRGETIRELQSKSGAQIFVTRDRDATQGSHERSVLISGTEQAILSATALVREIVRDAQSRRQGQVQNHGRVPATIGPILVETLTVPDDKVGLIIGKGGAAIRELQSLSGAKIQVAKEDEASPNNNTRPVTITGVRNCIDTAKSLIADKVNMHLPQTSAIQTFSPQQPAYVPPNAGMYYPIYEHGFPAHPMQAGPYQQMPPPFDPADQQQQAQMRAAAMAYYHQYHHGYYHAHPQMQFNHQHMQQHQGNAEGQEQHGGEHPNDSATLGEAGGAEGKAAVGEGASQSPVDAVSPTMHRSQPQLQFGMQDQPVAVNSMSGAQSQGISHLARQPINMQQQQHMPPRRMMPQPHFMAAAQHQRVVHNAQLQAQMANLQTMAHFAANAQRTNGTAAGNNNNVQDGTQPPPAQSGTAGHELTQHGGNATTTNDVQQSG